MVRAVDQRDQRVTTFAALGVRDFRNLWLAATAGHVGFWTYLVAQGWLAWELTGSATFLGLVNAVAGVSGLLLMLPGGVAADRWNRRRMVLLTNLVLAVAGLGLAAVLAAGVTQPWHLLVFSLVTASATTLNLPPRQSLGPQLVGPRLVANAVALNAVAFSGSRVIGPAVAGVLIATTGLASCFYLVAACFVAATLLTLAVGSEPEVDEASRRRSLVENLVDGLRYVRDEPVARGTIVVAALHNLFGMAYLLLLPVFASDVLRVGGGGFGLLMAGVGAGSIVGALAAARLSGYPPKGALTFTASVAFGVATVLFVVVEWLPLALGALVVLGATQAVAMIVNQMILNLALPDELRGRVMSVFMLTWNISPLAALPAGWAADRVGAQLTVGASGVLVIASLGLAAIALGRVRRFRDESAVPL